MNLRSSARLWCWITRPRNTILKFSDIRKYKTDKYSWEAQSVSTKLVVYIKWNCNIPFAIQAYTERILQSISNVLFINCLPCRKSVNFFCMSANANVLLPSSKYKSPHKLLQSIKRRKRKDVVEPLDLYQSPAPYSGLRYTTNYRLLLLCHVIQCHQTAIRVKMYTCWCSHI